jgi:hypothetical protein
LRIYYAKINDESQITEHDMGDKISGAIRFQIEAKLATESFVSNTYRTQIQKYNIQMKKFDF